MVTRDGCKTQDTYVISNQASAKYLPLARPVLRITQYVGSEISTRPEFDLSTIVALRLSIEA